MSSDCDIPRAGVSRAGLERFAAELAAATRGLPGGYELPAPGAELRREVHAHRLKRGRDKPFPCSVCRRSVSAPFLAARERLRAASEELEDVRRWGSRLRCEAARRRLREAKRRLDATRQLRFWYCCDAEDCVYDECARCFAESRRLRRLPAQLTTDAVNKLAMAHLTASRRCAYSDTLLGDPALVGVATTFVSHAWAMRFDALVATLREVDRAMRARDPDRTPYFWVDVVVNDQFAAPSRPFSWWQTVFRENVRRIGHTVVALEWKDPKPLTRIWCLWEVFCSTTGAGEFAAAADDSPGGSGGGAGAAAAGDCRGAPQRPSFELFFPPASSSEFNEELVSEFESLEEKLGQIDLGNADAFHGGSCSKAPGGCPAVAAGRPCPNDRALILTAVNSAPGGVGAVTSRIVAGLRDWMVSAAHEAIKRGTLSAMESKLGVGIGALRTSLAKLLRSRGRLDEAEALLRDAFIVNRRKLGDNNAFTLESMEELADFLRDRGKVGEAALLAREVQDRARRLDAADAAAEVAKAARKLAPLARKGFCPGRLGSAPG